MYVHVYTCIHVDIYTYTHRYTYIHCIHECIYLHKATCESVISTKLANATTLPPKPRAYLMSVKASIIKQNNKWYSQILNHNKQMRIVSFVLQHYRFKQNQVRPVDAYMCQWTGSSLDQIMAWGLSSAKPLSEPMQTNCQLDPKEHKSMQFYSKFKIFIKENSFENVVCKMALLQSCLGTWIPIFNCWGVVLEVW